MISRKMGSRFVILLGLLCICTSVESAPHRCSPHPNLLSYNHPNPFANKEIPKLSTVLSVLKEELASNSLYQYFWNNATKDIEEKKDRKWIKDPMKYFTKTTPVQCYIAIRAYTLDYLDMERYVNGTKLYRDFNDKFSNLTDETSWEMFPYKSLYYLLHMAVPRIRNHPNPRQNSYRGLHNIHFDPVPKIGQLFYFAYFASFTTDFFIARDDFRKETGTIIKLDGGASFAMGIDGYSRYDELEVLVFPRNRFRVKDFISDGFGRDTLVLEEIKTVYD